MKTRLSLSVSLPRILCEVQTLLLVAITAKMETPAEVKVAPVCCLSHDNMAL